MSRSGPRGSWGIEVTESLTENTLCKAVDAIFRFTRERGEALSAKPKWMHIPREKHESWFHYRMRVAFISRRVSRGWPRHSWMSWQIARWEVQRQQRSKRWKSKVPGSRGRVSAGSAE